MVVGATGAGKSTLINGLINYLFGISWDDKERLLLVRDPSSENSSQADSQTKAITSYTIHHSDHLRVPFTVTIIDTPGFGDTGGYSRDEQITEQIRNFFMMKNGIDHINAVGFVTQSSLSRLTPTQTYIFDKILSLFGKDIEENIIMMLTFADAQEPQVLSGIKKAGFKYNEYFKFNNSAVYAKNMDDPRSEKFNKMFWEMGEESFGDFFQAFVSCKPKSLCLTKEVLDERHQLELLVCDMQTDISDGLNKLENLTNEMKVVLKHEALIDANKHFTYEQTEEQIVKEDISGRGRYTTNCLDCNFTCHYPCGIPDNADKRGCSAMSGDNCRKCPKKCHWERHNNMSFILKSKKVKVKKTSEDLFKRYNKGLEAKTTADKMIQDLKEDFNRHQLKLYFLTESVRQSVERLAVIALKPNPMSTVDYIETLIDAEKSEHKPGFKGRVNELEKLKSRTEIFVKMIHKGEDPFSDYIDAAIKSENTIMDQGYKERVADWKALKLALKTAKEEHENVKDEKKENGSEIVVTDGRHTKFSFNPVKMLQNYLRKDSSKGNSKAVSGVVAVSHFTDPSYYGGVSGFNWC